MPEKMTALGWKASIRYCVFQTLADQGHLLIHGSYDGNRPLIFALQGIACFTHV